MHSLLIRITDMNRTKDDLLKFQATQKTDRYHIFFYLYRSHSQTEQYYSTRIGRRSWLYDIPNSFPVVDGCWFRGSKTSNEV